MRERSCGLFLKSVICSNYLGLVHCHYRYVLLIVSCYNVNMLLCPLRKRSAGCHSCLVLESSICFREGKILRSFPQERHMLLLLRACALSLQYVLWSRRWVLTDGINKKHERLPSCIISKTPRTSTWTRPRFPENEPFQESLLHSQNY